MYRQIPLLGLLLATGGCQLFPGCDQVLISGITVTVLDSITGGPLATDGARVVAIDGAFADTAVALADGRTHVGVYFRSGVYRVEVTSPGYSTWVRRAFEWYGRKTVLAHRSNSQRSCSRPGNSFLAVQ